MTKEEFKKIMTEFGFGFINVGAGFHMIGDAGGNETEWLVKEDGLEYRKDSAFGCHFSFEHCELVRTSDTTLTLKQTNNENGPFINFYNYEDND